MRRTAGFTLIELMVVVAIVAILASIAIPSYSKYVQRGDLVEATQTLSQFRVQMEQWYQDKNTYADAGGNNCGVNPPATPPLVNFQVVCALQAGTNGQAYTATATGINQVAGFTYTIKQDNSQQTLAIPASWGALPANAATSWIIR
jgi:type IV pilus assembly protein PilE